MESQVKVMEMLESADGYTTNAAVGNNREYGSSKLVEERCSTTSNAVYTGPL